MHDEVFEAYKKVLEDKERKEFSPERYWNEISNGTYFYYSVDKHIEEAKSLTKAAVLIFFEVFLTRMREYCSRDTETIAVELP